MREEWPQANAINVLIATRCIEDSLQLQFSARAFDLFVNEWGLDQCSIGNHFGQHPISAAAS